VEALAGATRVNLAFGARGMATGQMRLPVKNATTTLLQMACAYDSGETLFSRPVPFRLIVEAVQTASNAMPMTVLNRAPERYADKTVVVGGYLFPGVIGRGEVYYLQVANENNVKPMNLEFLTTRAIKTQLGELPASEQFLPVHLTCLVGKRDPDGVSRVRVTRIDFIGRDNRLVKTIPSTDGADDPLVALHRSPEAYVGKTVVFQALLLHGIGGRGGEFELTVLLPSKRRPDNLHFTTSRDVATQFYDEGLKGQACSVRLTGHVENRKFGSSFYVTVLKIELLDEKGQVWKTIQ
jgi:hypothetical protein